MANDQIYSAIGIDVGGTKISGAVVVFPDGRVTHHERISTRLERGSSAVLDDLIQLVDRLAASAHAEGPPLAGVGIGICELVDTQGHISSNTTLDWQGIDLTVDLRGAGPVVIDADVRAAALAEARFGAGRRCSDFVYVTVGTGISACLVQNGIPYTGARGNALLLGSSRTSFDCQACGTRASSSLEELASGPGLLRRYLNAGGAAAVSAEEVCAGALAGDAIALRIIEEAGTALGQGIAFVVNLLDPEAVVIGGGLGLAGGLYWEHAVQTARRSIWAESTRTLPIVPAGLGAHAGVVGSASLVRPLIETAHKRSLVQVHTC
jgi:glucokinase